MKNGGIFYGWWVVLAAAVGLFMSSVPIIAFTFGVFLNHLSQEFAWSRGEISLAFSISMLAFGLAQPLVGRRVDRIGARKIALPAVFVFGVCLISLYELSSSLWHLYAVYVLIGLVGAGTTSIVYLRVLTRWFDKRRGLAIGLALTGNGLSALAMPSLAQWLIDAVGWRTAYVLFGIMVITITLPVVGLLLKESPRKLGLQPDGVATAPAPTVNPIEPRGRTNMRDVLLRPTFWLIGGAFFLVSTSLVGCMTHLVPLLVDRGVSAQSSAAAASALGGAVLLGRITVGYLLDRFSAPYVTAGFFGLGALGILLLASASAIWIATVGAVLVGIASSSDGIIPYMVSRFFELGSFGEIYGYIVALNVLGWMCGPLVMGTGFDFAGSYQRVLFGFLLVISVAIVLMMSLAYYRRRVDGGDRA